MKTLARDPAFMAAYNGPRLRAGRKYISGSLGELIHWYEAECPKYRTLAPATQKSYSRAFAYLKPEYDVLVDEIEQADIYDFRDKCAEEKWPRFADQVVSALSSMFSQAVKRRKMRHNPAKGLDKAHKASHNANREWTAQEVAAALAEAPEHIATVLMLARYAGFRGQTIHKLGWREYQTDASFGMCFRTIGKKNGEVIWVPASSELQTWLGALKKDALRICTKADGTLWPTEVHMQTDVSHFLRELERAGKIGEGTTLHGLRVTYAADLGRSGADTGQIAAALGDKSERMGAHYTRHVENEAKVVQAFSRKIKSQKEQS
ncbi:MAG: tyrosine-type recombinase/integrase [Rhizobiales bacterium]|nr:tyrosine-type recombinase/integrase [Hyphomicrobiales bacterium]